MLEKGRIKVLVESVFKFHIWLLPLDLRWVTTTRALQRQSALLIYITLKSKFKRYKKRTSNSPFCTQQVKNSFYNGIKVLISMRMKSIQDSRNKTLRFLCSAQAWLCLRLSGSRQQFGCHWSRSPTSCMSRGNGRLRFHQLRQQYLHNETQMHFFKMPAVMGSLVASNTIFVLVSNYFTFCAPRMEFIINILIHL